jgi:hypothetical protein
MMPRKLALSFALPVVLLCNPAKAITLENVQNEYVHGNYGQAERDGTLVSSSASLAVAARAALAEAALSDTPCMDCLKRAKKYASQAISIDPKNSDAQTWLAVTLGYQGRIIGKLRARWQGLPGRARHALDAAIAADPDNAFAVAGLGGWNIEIVHSGGALLAQILYGATEAQGLALFEAAEKKAPYNPAIHYQIALTLAGFDAQRYRARISSELGQTRTAHAKTAYEEEVQRRATTLLDLLASNQSAAFARRVRLYQGCPD